MIVRHLHSALLLLTALTATAVAQDNPVYVDESPTAVELLKQADALTGTNPGEAANVLQSLLEDSGGQVVPFSTSGTRFTGIRSLVLQRLRANPTLLESWTERFSPAADAMYERGELNLTEARWPLTDAGLQAMLELGQRQGEQVTLLASLDLPF